MKKILFHNFINSGFVRPFLRLLPVSVIEDTNLIKESNKSIFNKNAIYIITTIDTESGYVHKNKKRIWQDIDPDAYEGYLFGIDNWLRILRKYRIKASFLLDTQCFSAKDKTLREIISILNKTDKEGHEIGFHLHPKNDFALQKYLNQKFNYNSSKFYKPKTIKEMLLGGRALIKKHLGAKIAGKIISFRWGNWGIERPAIKLLEETGFKIDSSACPGIKGHVNDDRIYDWTFLCSNRPFFDGKVLEIPIATFKIGNISLHADPVFSDLLIMAFDRLRKKNLGPHFFVLMSHSSEGTYKNGTASDIITTMDRFFKYAKRFPEVKFITLKEALEIYIREKK